mmetsp:Transcript_36667/g.85965  ORF Transcript_36667/g.85965 Transcript_36667/m.85965 type:complete len:281 (-) Transcript_36667:161-1003(-)
MVKSLVGAAAAATAVYGASRAFVPSGTSSSAAEAVTLRGAAAATPAAAQGAASLCSQVAIGAAAGVACIAAVRGAKVARRGKYVNTTETRLNLTGPILGGPVGQPSPDAPEVFCDGMVGSEYGGFGGKYEWDPLGFSVKWPEHVPWYREAELKHGRLAMLAFVGLCAPDAFRIPIAPFTDPNLDFVNAHNALVADFGPMWLLFAATGIIESQRFKSLGFGFKDLNKDNAGDLGVFPLPKDEELSLYYQVAELKNGRLAMLAVSGIFTAGVFWDKHHFPFF